MSRDFDNAAGSRSTTLLLYQPPSSCISNRKSGIRNPNNHRVFNRFHFSNRKYSAIFYPEARRVVLHFSAISLSCPASTVSSSSTQPPVSSFQSLIETPRLEIRVTSAISITSNFLIETKVPVSALPWPLASLCPNLRVSVPPWPIFAIMAGSN